MSGDDEDHTASHHDRLRRMALAEGRDPDAAVRAGSVARPGWVKLRSDPLGVLPVEMIQIGAEATMSGDDSDHAGDAPDGRISADEAARGFVRVNEILEAAKPGVEDVRRDGFVAFVAGKARVLFAASDAVGCPVETYPTPDEIAASLDALRARLTTHHTGPKPAPEVRADGPIPAHDTQPGERLGRILVTFDWLGVIFRHGGRIPPCEVTHGLPEGARVVGVGVDQDRADCATFYVRGIPPGDWTPSHRMLDPWLDGPAPSYHVEIQEAPPFAARGLGVRITHDERGDADVVAIIRHDDPGSPDALRLLDTRLADLERNARHARRLVAARLATTEST